MKNKVIAILAIILVVGIAWVAVVAAKTSKTNKIAELSKQVAENVEVKTYKNTIPLYKELINIETEEMKWYVGLADAYYAIEQYGNYKSICEAITSKFPNDKTGYKMLMEYYSEIGKYNDVISTYRNVPEKLKNDDELTKLFEQSEWKYKFLASSYEEISVLSGEAYLVKSSGLYGYRFKNVDDDIKCKFENARPFIEEFAAVYKGGEWYFIDTEGDRVLASKQAFEDLYSFSEGFAVAKLNGKYGYIDKSFKEYSFEYDDATSFYNGVACVKKGGKWAIIDRNFKEVTGFAYDEIIRDAANICSRKGVLFLKTGDYYSMVDLSGNKITDQKYEDANLFYADYTSVKMNGKWGFVDQKGKEVIPFEYDNANTYSSGLAAVCKDDVWGLIDENGKLVLDYDYQGTFITSDNGIAVLRIGDRYRFIQFIKFQ